VKTNVYLYFGLSLYFLVFSVIYPIWVFIDGRQIEWIGTLGIPLTMIMFLLLGGFLFLSLRRQGRGLLPEDNEMADVDDGDTDMGYYLPWSWWPFFAGAAAGILMLAMSVGIWLALFSLGLVLITFVGWFFEPFRNQYRR
jgi:hypothetical protein